MKLFSRMAFLICACSALHLNAQTSITVAGRSGYILVPSVVTGSIAFSAGVHFGADWKNKNSRGRALEYSYDKFFLYRPASNQMFNQYSAANYTVSILRLAYGFRSYPFGANKGCYGEFLVGGIVAQSEGLGSKADNTMGFAISTASGLGYAGKLLAIGLQFQVAFDPSVIIYPTIQVGFHFMQKPPVEVKTKTVD